MKSMESEMRKICCMDQNIEKVTKYEKSSRVQLLKHCEYNNQNEYIGSNSKENNDNTSSQKFWQKIFVEKLSEPISTEKCIRVINLTIWWKNHEPDNMVKKCLLQQVWEAVMYEDQGM